MRFYAFMQRVGWPRSYVGKTMAICFVGTHVPLIALVGWLIWDGHLGNDWGIVLVVLVATLIGTAGTLLGLAGMLMPILKARKALDVYARERVPPDLPTVYEDAAGQLMKSVQSTLMQLDRTLDTLESLSVTDPLTGLYNRRWIDDIGERTVAVARRQGRAFSMLVIDVDRFKSFNDNHGHALGDQVLILVADAIREGTRDGGQGVRQGGDEFCVLLSDCDREGAEAVAKRIRLATELGVEDFLRVEKVTLSIGVATLRASDQTLHDLRRRADEQLLHAKRTGRDRLSIG